VSGALARTDWLVKKRGEVEKVIDLMFGTSLSEHVLSGYKFLMRYHMPGDQIYIFGFSRGAYTARFLAEMLDDVGLLPHGNEEMVDFAWDIFSQWQCRKPYSHEPGETVEDKARESRWTRKGRKRRNNRKNYEDAVALGRKLQGFRKNFSRDLKDPVRFLGLFDTVNSVAQFEFPFFGRASSKRSFPFSARSSAREIWHAVSIDERRIKFRPDLVYEALPPEEKDQHRLAGPTAAERKAAELREDDFDLDSPDGPRSPDDIERHNHDTTKYGQEVHEVWFAGNHGDVGGGWANPPDGKSMNLAHVPLVWMVRAAKRAGVLFDQKRLERAMASEHVDESAEAHLSATVANERVHEGHRRYLAMMTNPLHDVLVERRGMYLWMEYMPFRRMRYDEDTHRWSTKHWPLSRGDSRDVPHEAKLHESAIERMRRNPAYRPRNVLLGRARGVPRRFYQREPAVPEFVEAEWNAVAPVAGLVDTDEYGGAYARPPKPAVEKPTKHGAKKAKAKAWNGRHDEKSASVATETAQA